MKKSASHLPCGVSSAAQTARPGQPGDVVGHEALEEGDAVLPATSITPRSGRNAIGMLAVGIAGAVLQRVGLAGQGTGQRPRTGGSGRATRARRAHPFHHLHPDRRCRAVDRAAGPSDPHPPARQGRGGLRPGGRGRLRPHAEPRLDHRADQAPLPAALAGPVAQVAGTRWDLVVDLRGSAFAWLVRARRRARDARRPQPGPQDGAAWRAARARSAAAAGRLVRPGGRARAAAALLPGRAL